jgi:hypothetical protein
MLFEHRVRRRKQRIRVLTKCKQLLGSSRPVVVASALVAVFGITGTAYSAKLITGLDVRDGSLTTADLSKGAQSSLHGAKGTRGAKGAKGVKGVIGAVGRRGVRGIAGVAGAQGINGGYGQTGAQGPIGLQGLTGSSGAASTVAGPQGPIGTTGAASTVPGPQGPIGPGGTTEGAACTVAIGRTGIIHWVDAGSGTEYSLHCVAVNV